MMDRFAESVVEEAALAWFKGLGYTVRHGPEIAVGMSGAARTDAGYRDVVLEHRLRQALVRLNPDLPAESLEDAYRTLTRADASTRIAQNHLVHRMLVEGVTVEYRRTDDSIAGAQARVIDFVLRRTTTARGQPVRAGRGSAHPSSGRRAVRELAAARAGGPPTTVTQWPDKRGTGGNDAERTTALDVGA